MKETVTLDEAVGFLNMLLGIDRPALAALFMNRVPCNNNMAKVVRTLPVNGNQVGMLGIINGLFGTLEDGRGAITLDLGNRGEIAGVRRTDADVEPEPEKRDGWRGENGEG